MQTPHPPWSIIHRALCGRGQDKILHKPMLAEERVYASPYTHRARFPSLSPLAGREPERGVPLIVELLPRRILSCALWGTFLWKVLARRMEGGLSMPCSLIVHGWLCHPAVASAGKLVKFEHGCATVTGYNLPGPLVPPSGAGKAGVRSETRKSGHQHGYTLVGSRPRATASPSKRRMRPAC